MKRINKKLVVFVLYLTICCIVPLKIIETNGFGEEVKRGFFSGIGSKLGEEIFRFLYNHSKKAYNNMKRLFRKIPFIGHPRKAAQLADILFAKVWTIFTTGQNDDENIEELFRKDSVKKFEHIWKNCVIRSWEKCINTPVAHRILLPSLKCFYAEISLLLGEHHKQNCDNFLSYINNNDMRHLEIIWDITPAKHQQEIIAKYPYIKTAAWYLRMKNINKTNEELYTEKWFQKMLNEAQIDIMKNQTETNNSPSILNKIEGNELYKLFTNSVKSVAPNHININKKNEKKIYIQTLDYLLPLIRQKVHEDIFRKSFYDKILLYRQLLRDIEITANEILSALLQHISTKHVTKDDKHLLTVEKLKPLYNDTVQYEVKGFTFSFNFDSFLSELKRRVNTTFYNACFEFFNTGKHTSIIKKKMKKITPYDLENPKNFIEDNEDEDENADEDDDKDEEEEEEEKEEVVKKVTKTEKEENQDQDEWDFENEPNEEHNIEEEEIAEDEEHARETEHEIEEIDDIQLDEEPEAEKEVDEAEEAEAEAEEEEAEAEAEADIDD